MRRTRKVVCLLAGVALVAIHAAAVDLAEVGLRLYVSHDPLLVNGSLQAQASIGLYGRLAFTDRWAIRISIDNPLGALLPRCAVATVHAIGGRWFGEAELSAQGSFDDLFHVMVNAGVRAVLSASEASRTMLSSFPLSLVVAYVADSGWLTAPVLTPNVQFDVSWAPSERLVVGQSIGVSLVSIPAAIGSAAIPVASPLALQVHATTRAGFRP